MKKNVEKLHPGARKELAEKLKPYLNSCDLDKGSVKIEPGSGWGWDFAVAACKHRAAFIDPIHAWTILIDQISEQFESIDYKQRPTGKLSKILKPSELKALEEKIINFIGSIPRKYTVFLRLYAPDQEGETNIPIGKNKRIFKVENDSPIAELKGRGGFNALARLLAQKNNVFSSGDWLVEFSTEGLAQGKVDDSALAAALSSLKCLLYLGKLKGLFGYEPRYSSWLGTDMQAELFFVDEMVDNKIVESIKLPSELGTYISGFFLASGKKDPISEHVRLNAFKTIGNLLDAPDRDINRGPLITATEWLFDSLANTNETVSFVQLCIALEAILGDEKLKEGITRTLSDRCAYLLGSTPEIRSQIREDFGSLYDYRSKIVHGRHTKLQKDAYKYLNWGRSALDGIIRREFQNFRPAKEKTSKQKRKKAR